MALKPKKVKVGEREVLFISLAAVVAISLLFYFLFLKGQLEILRDLRARVGEKKVEVEKAEKLVAKKDTFEKEKIAVERELAVYERRLPSEKEVPLLFKELSQIADQSGIKFMFLGRELPHEGELWTKFSSRYELRCGYHELGRFINRLERMSRFVKVEEVTIGGTGSVDHRVGLVVSTFVSE